MAEDDIQCARTQAHVHAGLPHTGYTQLDFAKVVKAILDSKHHAVDKMELIRKLGVSIDAINAMVRKRLISERPYSKWARKIDEDVFGDSRVLVTAPTPVHLYMMKMDWQLWLRPLGGAPAKLKVRSPPLCTWQIFQQHNRLMCEYSCLQQDQWNRTCAPHARTTCMQDQCWLAVTFTL